MDYPGRNPWMVLGLAEGASRTQIRRAFLQQVRATHPDAGGRAEHFIAVKAAYDALRDELGRDESTADAVEIQEPLSSPYERWLRPTGSARYWAEPSTQPAAAAPATPVFSELLRTEMVRVRANAA